MDKNYFFLFLKLETAGMGLKGKLHRIFLLFIDAQYIHIHVDLDTSGNKERLVSPGHHRIISG